ncbi:ferredoxin reductase domain-containing protein [Wolbachia endosymbiont of Howardula sp.]|uniref:oxidoreductase n=1 Tax=Wolbachia endosymbiont of Howardula sp. TaxID=2916816 RepID=UPI00217E888C|nr:oxidoreductase [Wolbachia endosymbiont of Howardula sp.]UWI83274.1 oxidoreductase [Wolbachia endosymbiont of Howardula sp.]
MSNIMLVGGGVGNAVLFSIGQLCLKKNNKVLYFAGFKRLNDVFKRNMIETVANVVVWTCEEGMIEINRMQDQSFHGNIVEGIIAYQLGRCGIHHIQLQEIDTIITVGSVHMMKAINHARMTILKPYLKSNHIAISSINSPMQCMMKEICAQCLQRHFNVNTGQESFVYSCSTQDQNMEYVDFDFLSERLMQNSLQEKLTVKWIEYHTSIS